MLKPWLKNGRKLWINGRPILCELCPCDDSSSSDSSSSSTCHLKIVDDDPRYPTGAAGIYYPDGDPYSLNTKWYCSNGNHMQYEERWVVGEPYYRWYVYYFSIEAQEWTNTEISRGDTDIVPEWTEEHPAWGDLVFFTGWYTCEDESSSSDSSSSNSDSSSSGSDSSSSNSDSSSSGGGWQGAGEYSYSYVAMIKDSWAPCCVPPESAPTTMDEAIATCAERTERLMYECEYIATEEEYNRVVWEWTQNYNAILSIHNLWSFTVNCESGTVSEECRGKCQINIYDYEGYYMPTFGWALPNTLIIKKGCNLSDHVQEDDIQ